MALRHVGAPPTVHRSDGDRVADLGQRHGQVEAAVGVEVHPPALTGHVDVHTGARGLAGNTHPVPSATVIRSGEV